MLSDEQIKALWYKRKRPTVDGVYTHHLMEFARAVAEAAVKDAVGGRGFDPIIHPFNQVTPPFRTPQASAAVPEDAIDAVSKAMTKAWQLGQDYWRQADGDTQAEWDESGHTEVRFQTLLDETTSMLAASQPGVRNV